ncbi:MAG: 3-oxoacyl-ACP reductase FabG [Victivallales bacterium]|nr:3-oxoacyl-ACP reductase FabG [Victivallales bacterium]
MGELTGKVALVTGSSRGLGKGVALVLAEKGADVVVNYNSSRDEAEDVCKAVREFGVQSIYVQANVGKADDVQRLFSEIDAKFGKIDFLVNNAGTSRAENIFDITEENWDYILETNLKSVFLCSKAAMIRMRERKFGRIVNMSSMVAHQGALFGHVHYASTKGGILSFTKTLARTAAPYGITVNAVAPGIIKTELLYKTHGEEGVAKLASTVPLGLGEMRDVGLSVAFLCGEGGNYLTGICLDVNGGMYMH